MNPKSAGISVIIPAYNRAGLIGETMRSLLNQTVQAKENHWKSCKSARQRIVQGRVECVGWVPTVAKRSNAEMLPQWNMLCPMKKASLFTE